MKWKSKLVAVEEIEPAKVNANKMSDSDFDKLVKNIAKSGGLSSSITCYKQTDGKYVIIGGHHRFKACLKLCFTEVPVIYADECDLSRDEIVALQLSHNSLHGEDNKGILKRLFEEIQTIDFKDFAHIDIDEIGSIETFSSSIVPMSEHFRLGVILYKEDIDTLNELLELVTEETHSSEVVILANQEKTEEMYLELSTRISKKYNIKSSNTSFSKILELAKIGLEHDMARNN